MENTTYVSMVIFRFHPGSVIAVSEMYFNESISKQVNSTTASELLDTQLRQISDFISVKVAGSLTFKSLESGSLREFLGPGQNERASTKKKVAKKHPQQKS